MSQVDPTGFELRDLAVRLARQAGQLVVDGRRSGITGADTKSTITDVVTEWDRASERLLVDEILRARPDDGLIGEEGASRDGTSGIRWLIDPIDGTTNFLYDLPTYAVSIGVCDDEGALAGAVYIPGLDWMFAAVRGNGATLNGSAIHCSDAAALQTALVATGFAYYPAQRAVQAQRISKLLPMIRDIRRFGAASVDLCLVACGRVDAYFEEGLGPWDVAAGALIATESGCRVTTLEGAELISPTTGKTSVLATNPSLYPLIAAAIAEANESTI